MPAPDEHPPMTPHQLAAHISRYVDDNERHHDVKHRWLSDYLQSALIVVRAVGNANLDPGQRAEVNAFRAKELQAQIETKNRDIASLERELAKVRGS
ncbi:hypothetical protein ACWX0K_15190 [Nitrobacteraceae bacterium UC4446_H13]